jgi:Rad3-related DNA helicase
MPSGTGKTVSLLSLIVSYMQVHLIPHNLGVQLGKEEVLISVLSDKT